MTTPRGDENREPTLHGEPLPFLEYVPAPPPMRPRRDNSWLVIAVAAFAVIVVGLGVLVAWLLIRDGDAAPVVADTTAHETVVVQHTPVPTAAPEQTPQVQPTTPQPTTPVPTTPEPTAAPGSGGTWYAQFGAFNDYQNAVAEAARHYNAVILPGSRLGRSTNYVVARPAASRAEAEDVCAKFSEGACYVVSSE